MPVTDKIGNVVLYYSASTNAVTLHTRCDFNDAFEAMCDTGGLGGAVILVNIVPADRIVSISDVCTINPLNYAPILKDVHLLTKGLDYGVIDVDYFTPYGSDAKVSLVANIIEPSSQAKARIARQWLYMNEFNCVKLSADELSMYTKWSKDTVSVGEFEYMSFVAEVFGYINTLIYNGVETTKHGEICHTVGTDTKCVGQPFGDLPVCTKDLEVNHNPCKYII